MNSLLRATLYVMATTALLGCSDSEQSNSHTVIQPVKVITIGDGETVLAREFPGVVRANQRVVMAFQVPGRLVKFPVTEGLVITKGALLAELDSSNYRSNQAAAKAQLATMEANFNRAKDLISKKYVSQAEYDKIEASYNVAQTDYEKAQKALNDTRLLAPFDGVVSRTFVDNFQEVQAKEKVLNLQNNKELEIVVDVPESLIVRYSHRSDQIDLSARFEGIPSRTFPLSTKEHATEANPETQTFRYVFSIEETLGQNLLPGMTAIVRAQRKADFEGGEDLITVPLAAIVAGSGQQKNVWVVDPDNRVSLHPVVTGDLSGTSSILVQSGLSVGDTLVTAGTNALTEGMQVKPVDKVEF